MKQSNKSVRLCAGKHFENLETLYKDELLTDCTLCCKDGSLKVHKLILAASSRYFRRVFIEHAGNNAIFIMHGVTLNQLKGLVDLIYKGSIDVPSDNFTNVYDLAEDLQVEGLIVDGFSDTRSAPNRDTRYKGNKRVAVDFPPQESEGSVAKVPKSTLERRPSSSSQNSAPSTNSTVVPWESKLETVGSSLLPEGSTASTENGDNENIPPKQDDEKSKTEESDTSSDTTKKDDSAGEEDKSRSSLWARKERKFKCELCTSSFKRASHLTRHQLVHTGERPYACDQCDKAFSRHDKLKHHIHKTHELEELNNSLPPDALYTIDHVQFLTPEQTMFESSEPIITAESSVETKESILNSDAVPQKKGRGRPRKYPIVPKPLIKRPRGRPRIRPLPQDQVPVVKRPRGRPRIKREVSDTPTEDPSDGETYDITNMPYGDLKYLTKPLESVGEIINLNSEEEVNIDPEDELIEPLIEIKMEPDPMVIVNIDDDDKSAQSQEESRNKFLENIGLFQNTTIGKIGECTISVTPAGSSSTDLQ